MRAHCGSGCVVCNRKMERILASRAVCSEEKITSRVVCFDLCAQG